MTNELVYQYLGRKKIYTDVDYIDKDNIIDVISMSLPFHLENTTQMDFLLLYEGGQQPLSRKKDVRAEIDIKDIQNLAHYITDFKLSYNWGNPISFVKKSSKKDNQKSMDVINDMFDRECFNSKNQKLFRFIEICGIGFTYTNYKKNRKENEAVFDYAVIDPRYAFKVYRNDINETPILDVMIKTAKSGERTFYCYTKDRYYEIKDGLKIVNDEKKYDYQPTKNSGVKNPLGLLPLTEWLRDNDRMGCFEREIDSMNALNTKASDFDNEIAQTVQAIIHSNDVEFPKDKDGNSITPKTGEWVKTQTTAGGKTPFIKAIDTTFDYSGIERNILESANAICNRCFVPLDQTLGGGSTGVAMSLSAGWQKAESYANKQELVVRESLMRVMELVLKCIELSDYDKTIAKIDLRDIEPHILRNKTYDLSTKTNALATLIKHGISLKDALVITDISGDISQVIKNSQKLVDAYQNKELGLEEEKIQKKENKILQDESMQTSNSPIIDGLKMEKDATPKSDNKQNL